MKKLLPVILLLCVAGAWGTVLLRGQDVPKEYTEYLQNAETAYGQGYYVETLEWIQMAAELSEEPLSYEVEQRKRDSYYNTGDMDSYVAQCRALINQYPEQEENYVLLMEYYDQTLSYGSIYRRIDEYAALYPENTTLQNIQGKYDKMYDYFKMGYYDVQYATDLLINVQRKSGSVGVETETEEEALETNETDDAEEPQEDAGRELCRNRGNAVFDYGYQQMAVASDGLSCFVQTQDNQWKRVNISNNLLAKNDDVLFETVGRLSSSQIATAVVDGKCHFINEKMKVSDIEWEAAGTFSEGINAVKRNGNWALVTTENWGGVTEFPYTAVPLNSMGYCVKEGLAVVADNSGYYIIDVANGNQPVSENRYEELKAFESDQPTVYRSGSKWGFVNKYGEIYREAEYEDALPYKNGYAAVKQNGLWGYIDKNGKMIIEPQFQEALNVMSDGVAYVKNDSGYWDYIILYKLYYKNH